MKKQLIINLLVFLGLITLCAGNLAFSQDIEVKASINADKIGLDDMLVYTVTIKGINNPTQPDLSHMQDFRVAQTSRSTEFRFVNGVSSYYTNFIFYLQPLKTGVFNLPPVSYPHNGKEFKTQPFKVEVVKDSVSPPSSQQQRGLSPFDFNDDFFSSPFGRQARQPEQLDIKILPKLSRQKVFKGELVIFRILLYTRNRVRGVNMISNSTLPGFWQEWFPMGQNIEGKIENLDGKSYQVFEIRKAALFPSQSGKITIPSLKFEITYIPESFFGNPQVISRSTSEITLNVAELPSQSAGLPVGRFKMNVSTDKKEIDVNDILTLKIKLSGIGNVKTLALPEIKSNEDFKTYPPKVSSEFTFQEDGISGVSQSEIPINFNKTGNIVIPSLSFTYYDPELARPVTLQSQPIQIKVSGVKEKQESVSTIPTMEIIKKGEDIDFIKKGGIHNQDKTFYSGNLFTLLLVIPFLLNIGIIIKLYLYDRFITGSKTYKQRKLLNGVTLRLKNAKKYEEISPILEFYLKEKTGMGLSEINNQRIDQLLDRCGVGNHDIDVFIKIKSNSELSRFSPLKASDHDENLRLKEDIGSLIEILKRMDGKLK